MRYKDFGDEGNILRDIKGTRWIVDVELKGFDSPKLTGMAYQINSYLRTRFDAINGSHDDNSITFKIPLSEIGLK